MTFWTMWALVTKTSKLLSLKLRVAVSATQRASASHDAGKFNLLFEGDYFLMMQTAKHLSEECRRISPRKRS